MAGAVQSCKPPAGEGRPALVGGGNAAHNFGALASRATARCKGGGRRHGKIRKQRQQEKVCNERKTSHVPLLLILQCSILPYALFIDSSTPFKSSLQAFHPCLIPLAYVPALLTS
eukprot:745702-Hanusia_phi.AAC.6